jgi:hypothetical protein
MARAGSFGADINLAWDESESVHKVAMLSWDAGSLSWIKYVPAAAGSGGAGDASASNQTTEITKLTSIDGKLASLGQKAMAGSTPVVIASDQAAIPVTQGSSSTASLTSVASSATSVSILSSNSIRKGLILWNDSTATAYVAFAASSSTSAFTIKMGPGAYWEMATLYTGAISAIWDVANGSMRVTEL